MGSLISYIYLESLDVESNIGKDTSKRGGGGAGTGTWQSIFFSLEYNQIFEIKIYLTQLHPTHPKLCFITILSCIGVQ